MDLNQPSCNKMFTCLVLSTATKAPLQPAVVFEGDNLTVEQFLEKKFEGLVQELRDHADQLVSQLRKQYSDGAAAIQAIVSVTESSPNVCVTLKAIAGPHIGQRFCLEASPGNAEEVFKMGRSTGKVFKEHGVSLHRDKEISTLHAKIEIRNGEAFFVDTKSTNGSQLNGNDCEGNVAYRLKDADVITMGSTELVVHISNGRVDENTAESI
jgi:hypothetical protein